MWAEADLEYRGAQYRMSANDFPIFRHTIISLLLFCAFCGPSRLSFSLSRLILNASAKLRRERVSRSPASLRL